MVRFDLHTSKVVLLVVGAYLREYTGSIFPVAAYSYGSQARGPPPRHQAKCLPRLGWSASVPMARLRSPRTVVPTDGAMSGTWGTPWAH